MESLSKVETANASSQAFVSFHPKSRRKEVSTSTNEGSGGLKRQRTQSTTRQAVITVDETGGNVSASHMRNPTRPERKTGAQPLGVANRLSNAFRAVTKHRDVLADRTVPFTGNTLDIDELVKTIPMPDDDEACIQSRSLQLDHISFPLLPIDNSFKLQVRFSSPTSFAWINRTYACGDGAHIALSNSLHSITQCGQCAAATPLSQTDSPPSSAMDPSLLSHVSTPPSALPVPLRLALVALERATDTYMFPPHAHPLFPSVGLKRPHTHAPVLVGPLLAPMLRQTLDAPPHAHAPLQASTRALIAQSQATWRIALHALWAQTRQAAASGRTHQWYVLWPAEDGQAREPCVIRVQARPPDCSEGAALSAPALCSEHSQSARARTGTRTRTGGAAVGAPTAASTHCHPQLPPHPLLVRPGRAGSPLRTEAGSVGMAAAPPATVDAVCAWIACPSLALTRALIARGVPPPPPPPPPSASAADAANAVDAAYGSELRPATRTTIGLGASANAAEQLADVDTATPAWLPAPPASAPALWLLQGDAVAALMDCLITQPHAQVVLPVLCAATPFPHAQRSPPALHVGSVAETAAAATGPAQARDSSTAANQTGLRTLSTLTATGLLLPECMAAMWHTLSWLQRGALRVDSVVALRASSMLNCHARVHIRPSHIVTHRPHAPSRNESFIWMTPDLCTTTASILGMLSHCRDATELTKGEHETKCLYCDAPVSRMNGSQLKDYGLGSFVRKNSALISGYPENIRPNVALEPHSMWLANVEEQHVLGWYLNNVCTHKFVTFMGTIDIDKAPLSLAEDRDVTLYKNGTQAVWIKIRTA